uniref:DUF834 domain-containing protein n=1 Tax=Oryza glumipatula TaxID=40148 RepID=A0A0E0BR20_9ORYZ
MDERAMGEVARVREIGLGGDDDPGDSRSVAARPSRAEAVDKSEIGGGAEDTGEAGLGRRRGRRLG